MSESATNSRLNEPDTVPELYRIDYIKPIEAVSHEYH